MPKQTPRRVQSMASNRSDAERSYPRLHVEMRHLSDTAILVDGWLIENAKGKGRTVLRYCGSMDEARARKFQGAFQSMALTAATKTSLFTKTAAARKPTGWQGLVLAELG